MSQSKLNNFNYPNFKLKILNFFIAVKYKKLHLWYMKWVTVKEYAEIRGITLAAVYKAINENRVKHDRKFGKIVIAYKENELA